MHCLFWIFDRGIKEGGGGEEKKKAKKIFFTFAMYFQKVF